MATDQNLVTSAMSIDQTSAFDCVEHELLLKKLQYYFLDDDTLNWIRSYLQHRSSYIVVGSAQSSIRKVVHGVPQGTVLGPLLFLLYMNEFSQCVEDDLCPNRCHKDTDRLFSSDCLQCGIMTLYADDTQYMTASRSRMTNKLRLEISFIKIMDLLTANGLELNQGNTSLTEYMSSQKRTKLPGIPPELTVSEWSKGKFSDKLITDKIYGRILGGNIKNNLSWDSHLLTGEKAIIPATRRIIGSLHSIKHLLSHKAKLKLVNSLVLSKLIYIISLWGNTHDSILRKVQTTMNSAARLVLGCNKTTRQTRMMHDCNWLDVKELTEFHSLLQLFKTIRWNKPQRLSEKFQHTPDGIVLTQPPRLQLTSKAWRINTTEQWNNLPVDLRAECNLTKLKKKLKIWLIDRREVLRDTEPPD